MDLYDSDQTTWLESDDDDGEGLNALISKADYPEGWFYVKVRAFSSTETGSYSISLTYQWPDGANNGEMLKETKNNASTIGVDGLVEKKSSLYVFPNPTSDIITVVLQEEHTIYYDWK